MKKILILQHEDSTPPGTALEWCQVRGYEHQLIRVDQVQQLPKLNSDQAFIVCGGGMDTYQTDLYPWLIEEKKLIQQIVQTQTPYFGLCLGSQLLAEAAGGAVERMKQWEIGWWPVEFAKQQTLLAFHWHKFECILPNSVQRIASSEFCKNQFFSLNEKQFGVQFHPEVNLQWIELQMGGDLSFEKHQGKVHTAQQMKELSKTYQPALQAWFFKQLDQWASNF